ncbi:hypothetical protein OQA88_7410 [Cercophora sp. LCS_1]
MHLLTLLQTVALLVAPVLSTPTTIFTVPGTLPNSWFENLAVRPNGKILATRGDAPEIWQIDPATSTGSLLVSVAGAYNLTGIAEVVPRKKHGKRPETYIFASAYIPAPFTVAPGSAKVWKLRFSSTGTPSVSLLTALPSAGFLNGVAAWTNHRVLISDTELESVYLMDVDTASYTTPLTNMTGINGIQTAPGYLYWANHLAASLSRRPVDGNVVPTGAVETLASGQNIDDFAIRVDSAGEGVAYIGAMYDNEVVEVEIDPAPSTGLGATSVVESNLSGSGFGLCTVVVFGRTSADSGLLYATVGQGGASASVVRITP